MAFVDELEIEAYAGNGGDGVVRWLHEKGREFGGPSGGNGGNGGSVFVRGVRDIGILSKYRGDTVFRAEHGGEGMNKSQHGKNGEDLYIDLPIGSTIKNKSTEETFELLHEGEEVLLLRGGRGGLGNEHFKSSRNINPMESTKGKAGVSAHFYIELALIADAGFVGLPNVGKSSLLNALTRAQAKVANYHFTTLDPNLGDFYGFILADIPGVIEGASEGKGLGHKFLRHITRTKMLVHCISLESENVAKDYTTIRKELEDYSEKLKDKKEIVVLTKADTVTEAEIKEKQTQIKKETDATVYVVSIIDDATLKQFADSLTQLLESAT